MLRNLGVVEVASAAGSSQLQRASCRFGGQPVIERVVRRVSDAQRLDGVIVVMADTPDSRVLDPLVPPDIPVFVSSEPDPLGRMVAAIREYPTLAIVRVAAHHLFVDPVLIDGLVTEAEQTRGCDYVTHCSRDGRPTALLKLGLFGEWCRAGALRRANRETVSAEDRCQFTRYLYSRPNAYRRRLIAIPPQLDRHDLRLAIDQLEDLENAEVIFDALGPECLDWQRIAGLVDQQPALRRRMAALNRADAIG